MGYLGGVLLFWVAHVLLLLLLLEVHSPHAKWLLQRRLLLLLLLPCWLSCWLPRHLKWPRLTPHRSKPPHHARVLHHRHSCLHILRSHHLPHHLRVAQCLLHLRVVLNHLTQKGIRTYYLLQVLRVRQHLLNHWVAHHLLHHLRIHLTHTPHTSHSTHSSHTTHTTKTSHTAHSSHITTKSTHSCTNIWVRIISLVSGCLFCCLIYISSCLSRAFSLYQMNSHAIFNFVFCQLLLVLQYFSFENESDFICSNSSLFTTFFFEFLNSNLCLYSNFKLLTTILSDVYLNFCHLFNIKLLILR